MARIQAVLGAHIAELGGMTVSAKCNLYNMFSTMVNSTRLSSYHVLCLVNN